MNGKQIQHGDVLLWEVNELPSGVKIIKRKNGLLIVAEGEATGHHHAIAERGCRLYELKGDLYLEVTQEDVTITHDEHKPLPIPRGIYQIGQVKEYDHLLDMERRVVD